MMYRLLYYILFHIILIDSLVWKSEKVVLIAAQI